MSTIFLTYFAFQILILLLSYLIGAFFFRLFRIEISNVYIALFANVSISITVLTICTAMFFTKGVTVMAIILPVLALLYWYQIKYSPNKAPVVQPLNYSISIPVYIVLFLGCLLSFGWRFYQIYNTGSNVPGPPHNDIAYYSNLIDFLAKYGNENSSIDYIHPHGTSPYHYFELWFGVAIVSLTHLNTGLVLILLVFSLGPVWIWFGLISLLSRYKKVDVVDVVFCLLGVCVTGIIFDTYTKVSFMQFISVFTFNSVNYDKIFPIYVVSIVTLLFYQYKRYTQALLSTLILPVVFISTAIGVLSALFIWLLWISFRKKQFHTRQLFMVMGVTVCLFIFYKVTPAIHTHVATDFSGTLLKFTDFRFIRTSINVIIGTTIQIVLLFLPFAIGYLLNHKIDIKRLFSSTMLPLFLLVYIVSLAGWAFLHDVVSTVQIFSNSMSVILNLSAFMVLLSIWISKNRLRWYNIIFIVVVFANNLLTSSRYTGSKIRYYQSLAYINDIHNIGSMLSPIGAFIYTSEDYKNANFGYISNFSKPGNYLIYNDRPTFPLSISPFSYVLSEDKEVAKMEMASLVNTPFWQYVEKQKAEQKFESIEKSQEQFIEEYKINYLICTKNVTLPNNLQQKVKKVITDSNTGERFCILKEQKDV